MDPFLSQREVQKILSEQYVTPARRLGQSFLVDRNVLEKIVTALEPSPQDVVLEIGPGLGALTSFLIPRVHHLQAVEIDSRLAAFLMKRFSLNQNFSLQNQDFLETDLEVLLPSLLQRVVSPGQFKIIGNLPYRISTLILIKLLECPIQPERMVLAFQWEVAERLLAKPNSKDYGSLTLLTEYFTEVKKIIRVKKTCFYPEPEVDTGILSFRFRDLGFGISKSQSEFLFRLIRASFSQRRKTLKNSLASFTEISQLKLQLEDAFVQCHIHPQARAEDLKLEDFVRLAQLLY